MVLSIANRIKSIFGFLLIITGFVGFSFFRHYRGVLISKPGLWWAASIILIGLGAYLLSLVRKSSTVKKEHLASLVKSGNKIEVLIDDCTFFGNRFNERVEVDQMNKLIPTFGSLLVPRSLHGTVITEEDVERNTSSLIVNKTIGGELRTFQSQVFPVDQVTLQVYVMSGRLALYSHTADVNEYVFVIT